MILNRLKKVQFDSGYYLKQKYDLTSDHFYSRLATALLGSGLLKRLHGIKNEYRINLYFTFLWQKK